MIQARSRVSLPNNQSVKNIIQNYFLWRIIKLSSGKKQWTDIDEEMTEIPDKDLKAVIKIFERAIYTLSKQMLKEKESAKK